MLSSHLGLIRDRWRTDRVLCRTASFLGISCLVVLLAALAETFFFFPAGIRWALLIVCLTGIGTAGSLLVFRPMLEPLSLERVARMVELRQPELGNLLIGGLQLARSQPPIPALATAALRLLYRRNRGGELQTLAAWKDFPSPRSAQRATTWKLTPRDFDPGDVIYYFAEADDRVQTGRSPEFRIRLVNPRQFRTARLEDIAAFLARSCAGQSCTCASLERPDSQSDTHGAPQCAGEDLTRQPLPYKYIHSRLHLVQYRGTGERVLSE